MFSFSADAAVVLAMKAFFRRMAIARLRFMRIRSSCSSVIESEGGCTACGFRSNSDAGTIIGGWVTLPGLVIGVDRRKGRVVGGFICGLWDCGKR